MKTMAKIVATAAIIGATLMGSSAADAALYVGSYNGGSAYVTGNCRTGRYNDTILCSGYIKYWWGYDGGTVILNLKKKVIGFIT